MNKQEKEVVGTTEDMDFYFPDEFIKKSHFLIFSKIKLSSRAQDVFALFLGRLQGDEAFLYQDFSSEDSYKAVTYSFSVPDLCSWLNTGRGSIYNLMKRVSLELGEQSIGIYSDEKKEFENYNLFDHSKFKGGQFTIRAGHGIFPMMVDYITKGYSQVKHKPFRSLDNVHAKRIYEILSRFKSAPPLKPIKIETMYAMLGFVEDKQDKKQDKKQGKSYKNNSNLFIKRCLTEPLIEIHNNENVNDELNLFEDTSTGNIGFRAIRSGKKVTAIEFLYQWVKPSDSLPQMQLEEEEVHTPTNNPMIETYKEAYRIVMGFPNFGELTTEQQVSLDAVKFGLVLPIENYPYNSVFKAKLKYMQDNKNKN